MASEKIKDRIKRIEKSAEAKKAKFIEACNANPDLADFPEIKRYALHAYKLCRGNITNACLMINLSRRTFHTYINEDPEFAEMAKDIKFTVVDGVEDKLLQNCDAGKETSIIYFLNCQGKDRGYGNAIKVDGRMNNINYNVPLTPEEVRAYSKALEDEI